MGNKSNTEIKVLTFYDGDTEEIEEKGLFAFEDVCKTVSEKMIRRHPEALELIGRAKERKGFQSSLLTAPLQPYSRGMRRERGRRP